MIKTILATVIVVILLGNTVNAIDFTSQELAQGQAQIAKIEKNIDKNGEKTRASEIKKIERKMKVLKKNSRQYALLWEVRAAVLKEKASGGVSTQSANSSNNTSVITPQPSLVIYPVQQVTTTKLSTAQIQDYEKAIFIYMDTIESQRVTIQKLENAIVTTDGNLSILIQYSDIYRKKIEMTRSEYDNMIDKTKTNKEIKKQQTAEVYARAGMSFSASAANAYKSVEDEYTKLLADLETEKNYNISIVQVQLDQNEKNIKEMQGMRSGYQASIQELRGKINVTQATIDKYNGIINTNK